MIQKHHNFVLLKLYLVPIFHRLLTFVVDFMWSLSNDHILSSSMDGTSRLWEVASGKCIRVVQDPTNAEVLTCCFQPLNNNLFVVSFKCH